jgi:hypothetical protein
MNSPLLFPRHPDVILLYYSVFKATCGNEIEDSRYVEKIANNDVEYTYFDKSGAIVCLQPEPVPPACGSVKLCAKSKHQPTNDELDSIKSVNVTFKHTAEVIELFIIDNDPEPTFLEMADCIIVEDKWIVEKIMRNDEDITTTDYEHLDYLVEKTETTENTIRLRNRVAYASITRLAQCSGFTRFGNQCRRHKNTKDSEWYCFQHIVQKHSIGGK